MRRFVYSIIVLLLPFLSFAQSQDIESLDGLGYDEVVNRLGEPSAHYISDYDGFWHILHYDGKEMSIDYYTGELHGFSWWERSMCMLSSVIEGGIRVGDPITRIPSTVGNLHLASESRKYLPCPFVFNYVMFEDRCVSYWFSVDNGVIRAMSQYICEDATPPASTEEEIPDE